MARGFEGDSVSPSYVMALIGLGSYALSVFTAALMFGVKWGKLTSDVDNMKQDLAEIKGMFRLSLKE